MASVAEAAAQLRADLQLLDASTKEAAALLDLASWQLGELGRAAAPMTSKTLALARAKENISAAKQRSEEVLEHLDASRKMQGVIQAGPRANLEAFLAALGRLEAAIDFLAAHRSMQSAEDALRHTAALRDSALGAAGQEFAALLQKHSAAPQALLARLRAGSFASRGGGVGSGSARCCRQRPPGAAARGSAAQAQGPGRSHAALQQWRQCRRRRRRRRRQPCLHQGVCRCAARRDAGIAGALPLALCWQQGGAVLAAGGC
jgi:exocyst complex protein 7